MNQANLFDEYKDYSGQKVLLGLSGGINSMAVLCWLAQCPEEYKPKELHLQYHHFEEHSPDTLDFVLAGVEYAKNHFSNVIYAQSNNNVLEFFETQKILPHPSRSPCSRLLKIEPTFDYMIKNDIQVNVVGYVRSEIKRVKNMAGRTKSPINHVTDKGVEIHFPIDRFSDQWCLEICDKYIGWHPKIYDLTDAKGKRVFKHNNCLPCKNMDIADLENVKIYYPEYFEKAHQLTQVLNRHWGRDADEYYTTFGRPDYEKTDCEACIF